ncbi:hypothetical protein D3C87_1914130 [compost metagenome]
MVLIIENNGLVFVLNPDETLVIVGGAVDQVSENLFFVPLFGRRLKYKLRLWNFFQAWRNDVT